MATEAAGASRPPSLRSVASNASIGSASLARRSRTRTRSRTSPRPDVNAFKPPISPPVPTVEPQLYGGPMVGEPAEIAPEMDQGNTFSVHSDGTPKHSKAVAQALRLPDIATPQFKPPPSAFSRVPSIPQLYDLGGPNPRDSVLTHGSGFSQSGGSSSVYPPSTSTASGTESPPSPRSIAEQDDNNDVASFDPELDQDYDGDDVSYRLRLLVKNNYFLPPAHLKPSSSDFAKAKNVARPPTTPTFFDFFRKSRSRPGTPTGSAQAFDVHAPILRTTSDSTTVSTYSPQLPRRQSSSQTPQRPGAPQDPSGRVMVVREKMHDIATAAKQAEQEMKSRSAARPEESVRGHSEVDIIDPTDAVDLPPPSPAYPFAVQASALHEMGVQDSLGAALLADRLPPRSPVSPTSAEDDWRKALLHAAVNHSLNNSPGALPSPTHGKSTSAVSSPVSDNPLIGQRIISPPLVDGPRQSGQSTRRHPDEGHDTSRASSCLPRRVETPSMPLTPLAPPPRRQLVNPLYSISQTSLTIDRDSARSPSSVQDQRVEAIARLSDSYENGVRNNMLSPPLVVRQSSEGSNGERLRTSSESIRSSSDASFYSEEEVEPEPLPRPSISSSIPENRPSLSIYSQASPTTSAFEDAIHVSPMLTAPPRGSSLRGSLEHQVLRQSLEQHASSSASPVPRDSMASPPPRVSSSLAHLSPLPPPPRASSLAQRMAAPPRVAHMTPPPLQSDTSEIIEPGPSTPPFPISGRRGTKPLVLEIPEGNTRPSLRSAPAPSTPPSFFDSIQNQPNAMDDLDSSSDEDSDHGDDPEPPHTPIFAEPRTRTVSKAPSTPTSGSRSLLMRLGNHSTPYVGRSSENTPVSSKRAVGNTPITGSFFTERRGGKGKSDAGHGPPTSTFDFFQYAQQHPLVPAAVAETGPHVALPRRPHTSEQSVRDWQSSQKAQESLRRLDGMLIQHMEAEKDTIRRIATTLQSNARS